MRGAENRAGHITQLGFDSLDEVSASDGGRLLPGRQAGIAEVTPERATFGKPEVYRSAPQSRRRAKKHTAFFGVYNQSTFEDVFAAPSIEAEAPSPHTIKAIRGAREKKQQSPVTQLGFDSLAVVQVSVESAVPIEKPAENRTANNNREAQNSDILPAGRAEKELPDSLEESIHTIFPAGRR